MTVVVDLLLQLDSVHLLFLLVPRLVCKRKCVRVHRHVHDTAMWFASGELVHEVAYFLSRRSPAAPDTDFVLSSSPDASGDEYVDHFPFVADSNSHNGRMQVEIVLDDLDRTHMVASTLMSASRFLPHSMWG